ncbi:MAG: DUF2892 domain-containing protein [Salaquimonas sp.]
MFKSANVGSMDRLVRIVVGLAMLAGPYLYSATLWANPLIYWGVMIVGAVLVLTALVRFCPLYRLIGASTCKIN